MDHKITRKNKKEVRNQRIVRRYSEILKRMGSVKYLTPSHEIMEELADEFNIESTTVSRIISKELKEKK